MLERITKKRALRSIERVDRMTAGEQRLVLHWLERFQEAGRLNRESGPWVMAKLRDRLRAG